jgi:hypothetical protein
MQITGKPRQVSTLQEDHHKNVTAEECGSNGKVAVRSSSPGYARVEDHEWILVEFNE